MKQLSQFDTTGDGLKRGVSQLEANAKDAFAQTAQQVLGKLSPTNLKTAAYSALLGDMVLASGTFAVTLPVATPQSAGEIVGVVVKSGTITVTSQSKVQGAASDVLTLAGEYLYVSTGVDWWRAPLTTGVLPDPGSNGIVVRTGVGPTDVARSIAVGAGASLTVSNADGTAGNPTLTRAALTGQVTAPADSNTTTIATNTVANTNLAQMPTNTIKGNNTAGTANAADLTAAQVVAMLTISGRRLRAPQVLTSGTTITHPTGTATITVRLVGGGGGGGGVAAAGAGLISLGGGGGAGSYAEKTFTAASTTSTFAIGAAGTAGASGGGTGGAGGSTTFTHNAVTVTTNGGTGGFNIGAANTVLNAPGGNGGAVSTGGDVNGGGDPGGDGIRYSGSVANSGVGGSSPFGGGGSARAIQGAGVNAVANTGSGGAGALSINAGAAAAGGSGAAGIIIVEEYS